jgi:hypothetical protein
MGVQMMNRATVRMLMVVFILLFSVVIGLGTFYMASTGLLNLKIIGISFNNWIYILLNVIMITTILYDFINIRVNRKKYGPLKYVLKRRNKRTQVIGFMLLTALFIFNLLVLIVFNKDIQFMNISMTILYGAMPLMFGYRNLEKEGLSDYCIYFWGVPYKWDNVDSYGLDDNMLTLTVSRKVVGIKEIIKVYFTISRSQKNEIAEFVAERVRKLR